MERGSAGGVAEVGAAYVRMSVGADMARGGEQENVWMR